MFSEIFAAKCIFRVFDCSTVSITSASFADIRLKEAVDVSWSIVKAPERLFTTFAAASRSSVKIVTTIVE